MIDISDDDLHAHLRARMAQRGITRQEIEKTLNEGWEAKDSKSGTVGKVFVFPYNRTCIIGHGKMNYLKRRKSRCIIK